MILPLENTVTSDCQLLYYVTSGMEQMLEQSRKRKGEGQL
jgi:hypothetical protein